MASVALCVIVVFVLIAVLAPLIAPSPTSVSSAIVRTPNRPSFSPATGPTPGSARTGIRSRKPITSSGRIYEVGISYYGRTYLEGKKIGWTDGFRAIWCIVKYGL